VALMRPDESSESTASLYAWANYGSYGDAHPCLWSSIPLARSLISVGLLTDPRGPLAQLRRRF